VNDTSVPIAIVNARVWCGAGTIERPNAIAFANGRVAAIGEARHVLDAIPGERVVIDGVGASLVPGFVDAHTHVRAAASVASSQDLTNVRSADELLAAVAAAGRQTDSTWLSFANVQLDEPPTADRLEAAAPRHFVRIRHRSLHGWAFNRRALRQLRIEAPDRGWIHDADGRLGRHVGRITDPAVIEAAVARWSRLRLEEGVVAVLDASASNGREELLTLASWRQRGVILQELVAARRSGIADDARGSVRIAGVKILAEPGPDIAGRIRDALGATWAAGERAIVHCADLDTLGAIIEAIRNAPAGARTRIEHAAVCPPEWPALATGRGVDVVTHPSFIYAHGDRYLRDDALKPHDWLYRLRSWKLAGVRFAFGSDAPAGPASPLLAWRSAQERRTLAGHELATAERLTAEEALGALTTSAAELSDLRGYGRLTVGGPAAAVLLSHDLFTCDPCELEVRGVMSAAGWIAVPNA
jgi:predicted amidohydrolase YtcJ